MRGLGRPLTAVPMLLGMLVAVGCGDAPSPDAGGSGTGADTPADDPAERRSYERLFTFVSDEEGAPVIIPWLFTAETRPDGVHRTARGWVARGAAWDAFQDAAWTTGRSRAAWRILPHGPFRLVVDRGDRVQRLIFRAGNRWLELEPGPTLVEWSDARGGTYTVARAAAVVAGVPYSGALLDVARARRADAHPPGDWAFLIAADTLQLVLSAPRERAVRDSVFRGWARSGPRELRWDSVTVEWRELRAYEPARRNVPTRWSLRASEPALEADLEVLSSRLDALGGDGPVHPVEGFFTVGGILRVGTDSAGVTGILRHRQP